MINKKNTHKKRRKHKFRFNPETLSFEKIQVSFREYILKFFAYLSSGLVVGLILVVAYIEFFPSPRERALREENRELRLHYELLTGKLKQISTVVEELQNRDNNIYRMVFESEPIPNSVRKAGFGGVNRYEELEDKPNMAIVVSTTKQVDRLSKQLYIQSKSFDEIITLAKNKEVMLRSIPAIKPVAENGRVMYVSGFGYRIHPIYKTKKMHCGCDWSAPQGTKIYATGDGVVSVAEFDRGYGNHVVINHGFGFQTLYGHMSVIKARLGQKVKRGDLIGLTGNTGLSTGPHIHYEVHKGGVPIDPINYYLNDLSPSQYFEMINISSKPNQSFD